LVSDPYLTALIVWLQAENAPTASFWVADGLAKVLGWPRRQFANARKQAVATGWIVPITAKAPGRPISYRWGKAAARTIFSPHQKAGGRRAADRSVVEDLVPISVGVDPDTSSPHLRAGR
jgi:hypothetical protein